MQKAATTWTCPSGSSFLASLLRNKYIHTLELRQLFFPRGILRALAGSGPYSRHYRRTTVKKKQREELLLCASGDVKGSPANTAVACGVTDISTCSLASVAMGRPKVWLVGVLIGFLPFCCCRGNSSLQILQSGLGLNTTSYVSLPLLVLFSDCCIRVGLRRVLLFSSFRCVSKEVTCQTPGWTFQRSPRTLLALGGAPASFCPRLSGFCCALCWSP